jgi:hypothetical protein
MRRTRHRAARWADPEGSALLLSLLVTVVVTLLGITYLFLADTEGQIAANERDRAQVLGLAEAGARLVKYWYDNPILGDIGTPSYLFLDTYDIRKKELWDVDQRKINDDGDPGTPTIDPGDAGWVYYMEGILAPGSPASDTDPDHALRLLQKPYRGTNRVTILGTEDGPDLRLGEDSASAAVRGFLAAINDALFGEARELGRITAIEIYEPPHVQIGGAWERYGIATVKVTAAKFRPEPGGGERAIAERVVKMVLNEAPYPGPGGPLQSCEGIETAGAFEAHWGTVTAINSIEINVSAVDNKWDSAIPLADPSTYVDLSSYMADMGGGAGTTLEDPWLYLRGLGAITDAPNTDTLAWPTAYTPGSSYDEDRDHSNLVQFDLAVACPDMPYDLWKQVAKDGGKNVYYLAWDSGVNFRRNGMGPARSFLQWVNNNTGFFFFDTVNGRFPNGTNWTPAVNINGAWYTEGFIYLNAENFRTTGVSGTDIPILAPGEPYQDTFAGGLGYTNTYNAEPFTDANANGVWDGGEAFTDTIPPANGGTDGAYDAEEWVNLDYDTALGGGGEPPTMRVKQNPGTETNTVTAGGISATRTTTNARDDSGLPVQAEINMYGVMYNSGHFSAQGNGVYFGSVIAGNGVGEDYFGAPAAGTPSLYFDERLIKGEWPPPEIELPLTIITVWKTDY